MRNLIKVKEKEIYMYTHTHTYISHIYSHNFRNEKGTTTTDVEMTRII